jgi:hypothetical protein
MTAVIFFGVGEVTAGVELYLYSSSRPLVACYRETFTFYYVVLIVL